MEKRKWRCKTCKTNKKNQYKDICKKCYQQTDKYNNWVKKYNQTEERKAQMKRYSKSKKRRDYMDSKNYKLSTKKYRNSEKGKIAIKRFLESEKGRIYKTKKNFQTKQRRQEIIHSFSMDEWIKLKNKTNGSCPSCRNYVGIEKLELDHIIPVSKAKKHQIYTINDIQPLCRTCNVSKGNRHTLHFPMELKKQQVCDVI